MKTEYIEYYDGDLVCEGYIAFDENTDDKKPCILVCHAWGGQSNHERNLAIKMVELGFVGFAIDIYGKGRRGDPFQGNEQLMQPFLDDREMLRDRLIAAVNAAKNHSKVDPQKLGSIGLCFGGLCALDLARSASPEILGVVSFHGGLQRNNLLQKPITAKVLILHGFEDPIATPEQLITVAKELTEAEADWQINAYGHAMHAFTAAEANLPEIGIMYNENADKRSWQAMNNFLNEIFCKNLKII